MSFSAILKQLPENPGVYMMFDSMGNVIYVGKAKNLKKRVSQYFGSRKDREPKVADMIHNIHTFKWMVTDTELDAFIEECRLIKEIKPRYNRQMKFTHSYVYIRVPADPYPKMAMVDGKADDGALYFGPFTSPHRVSLAIEYLNDYFLMRKCASLPSSKKISGCLHWQIGRCLGVCMGRVTPDEYRKQIDKLKLLLNGKDVKAVHKLTERLNTAVEKLEFEKAAQYHEYYIGLRHVVGKQCLAQASCRQKNIIAIELVDARHIKLFFIKGNRLLYRELYDVATVGSPEFVQILVQMVRDKFAVKRPLPELSQNDIDEAQIIYSYLRRNKDRILCFWIPSSRLKDEVSNLESTLLRIIEQISAKASTSGPSAIMPAGRVRH